MQRSDLRLGWLEIFERVARSGSVQSVAMDIGLSVSTVSHHLLSLEQALGVDLIVHAKRPMVLTPAGTVFLRSIEQALRLIRRAENEVASGNLAQSRDLRLGLVEDFDSEVAPELAQLLANVMPNCTFRHYTRPSHEILAMLHNQKIDAGVATQPLQDVAGLVEYPLLRDPFVLACPKASSLVPEDLLAGKADLPFLRYSRDLIIGAQIETQLRRLKVNLPNRFELESNQSIMGIVAEGSGWAITTPTCYVRAQRFHDRVALHPFPGKEFSRTLSFFTTESYVQSSAELVLMTLRQLIERRVVGPVIAQMPWLASSFRIIPDRAAHTLES